jgi:hypothetical protein
MPTRMSNRRIIYANSDHDGGVYLEEAVASAKSFRQYIQNAEFVLYTNRADFRHDVFDLVKVCEFTVPPALAKRNHKNGQMLVKQTAMIESRAARNLVLGSDTMAVHENVQGIFDLLERFDIAAAHAPTRVLRPIPRVPRAFPEFNCDVILFRGSWRVRRVLRRWRRLYSSDAIEHPHDQGAFRYALYRSSLRVATLPFEYNDRLGKFGVQASPTERAKNPSVIIQNREEIQLRLRSGCWGREYRDEAGG